MMTLSRKPLLGLFALSAAAMMPVAFAQYAAPAPAPAAAPAPAMMHDGMAAPMPMPMTMKPSTFKQFDTNRDHKLSKEEVSSDTMWTSHFSAADTNKDGFLSRSEYKHHAKAMRKMAMK